LVAVVAVAIAEIQDHRRTEPFLLGLAGAGFAADWVLGWLGWLFARRFHARLGSLSVLILYLVTMTGPFLVTTVLYLRIEHRSLGGTF